MGDRRSAFPVLQSVLVLGHSDLRPLRSSTTLVFDRSGARPVCVFWHACIYMHTHVLVDVSVFCVRIDLSLCFVVVFCAAYCRRHALALRLLLIATRLLSCQPPLSSPLGHSGTQPLGLSMAQQKTVRSVAVWLGPSGALSLDALWRCITPALGTWCLAAFAFPALGHYCDWPPQRSAAPVLGALRQSTALALSTT